MHCLATLVHLLFVPKSQEWNFVKKIPDFVGNLIVTLHQPRQMRFGLKVSDALSLRTISSLNSQFKLCIYRGLNYKGYRYLCELYQRRKELPDHFLRVHMAPNWHNHLKQIDFFWQKNFCSTLDSNLTTKVKAIYDHVLTHFYSSQETD